MFKINLVPEVQEQKNKVKKMNATSVTVATVIMVITVGALVLISLAQAALSVQISSTNKKIAEVNKESEKYKELEETVISLEKGLAGVKEIYDGKNQWTKLLEHLEKATPNDVQYKTLKIAEGKIEATLEGTNVNSIARFVESYKAYQVIVLAGSGEANESFAVLVDGAPGGSAQVKSDGTWTYALHIDPAVNHIVSITGTGKSSNINYVAESKKIESTGEPITAVVKNLFTLIETKEYQKKEDGKVTFSTAFSFDGGLLW